MYKIHWYIDYNRIKMKMKEIRNNDLGLKDDLKHVSNTEYHKDRARRVYCGHFDRLYLTKRSTTRNIRIYVSRYVCTYLRRIRSSVKAASYSHT